MSTPPAPLYFPKVLNTPGLWTELGRIHGLTQRDFEWLKHIELTSQRLRSQQARPMIAERILLVAPGHEPVVLAGSFVLSPTPEMNGVILYTPYAGIQKYYSRAALTEQLLQRLLRKTEDDDLLAFMSLARRKTLTQMSAVQVTYQTIEGDVFEDQRTAILDNQTHDDQAMVDELTTLPTLTSMLDTVLGQLLSPAFPGIDQRQTQVDFYVTSTAGQNSGAVRRWANSLSLNAAVLLHYRNQRWPFDQRPEYSHPQKKSTRIDQQHWEIAVTTASAKLISLLSGQLAHFWNEASVDGASRRAFFTRAISEQARTELLLKREADIISPEQFAALHVVIQPVSNPAHRPTLETVRLWEHPANFVELAGSLMISHSNAYLYTPTQGLQVLEDYADLKDTLLSKFSASGHEDELYGLLGLEERSRFIGFHHPQVTGEVLSGSIFKTLFEAIIVKQQDNLGYVLQLLRNSDGAVDVHALFDKALDIRSMINERLLALEVNGRWSTRPVLSGTQMPSNVRADKAASLARTYSDIEAQLSKDFAAQPTTSTEQQRSWLERMARNLAHTFSVGLRGEAQARVLGSLMREADQAIVDTVFNPDYPERANRRAHNGFRPDVYSWVLECSGQTNTLPLANCILVTERGGLDVSHSGRAIVWTPAKGLEVFASVNAVRQQLSRRLLDPSECQALLENLDPTRRKFHQTYSLGSFRLIEGNVLDYLARSAIEHFLASCQHLRSLKLDGDQQSKALKALSQTVIDTNLRRATRISRAIAHQHSLPAWLGMAPAVDQQTHIELLEQYRRNVHEDKDYLSDLPDLAGYVHQTLAALLRTRFPGAVADPDDIEIIPDLALAGAPRSLTQFALDHVSATEGFGFTLRSKTAAALPAGLDQNAIRQLLLSLDIQEGFARKVLDSLSASHEGSEVRRLRFVHQLPWQLMQHAHALYLQQRLSRAAFDLIEQVLDMPDSLARATVQGAHAICRKLALIKTGAAAPIAATGLYLIGPGVGHGGPLVLYAPYHSGEVFTEFDSETSLLAAINAPGPLQDLIIRRLPENQQSVFHNLFQSNAGQPGDMSIDSTPLDGHLLNRLFSDNTSLLARLMGTQRQPSAQSDWEAAKYLFSSGIKLISGLLPGKLACGRFLWQSYTDIKNSAEALLEHHWTQALQNFIAGAAQMTLLGRLSLQPAVETTPLTSPSAPVARALTAPNWSQLSPTTLARTLRQPFETFSLALKDLIKGSVDGTYLDPASHHHFAAVAGKVYRIVQSGAVWRLVNDELDGPSLLRMPSGQMVIDPDVHTVHYGKALSKMHNKYVTDQEVHRVLNIEARGMEAIRTLHPEKAQMIIQAMDLARLYAFNSLHNLAQSRLLLPGTRLDRFFKRFFDLGSVDQRLLDKIKAAIVPICNALVDPNEDFMNTERFVLGSSKYPDANLIAFVVDKDARKTVHFTEKFFDQQLDWYKSCLSEPFDVDAHSQASTLIHEFSHLFSNTVDIATLEARRPFVDLVSPVTSYGAVMKQNQQSFQREALSLATPSEELFARWHSIRQCWIDMDDIMNTRHVAKEILKATGCATIAEARAAFLDPRNTDLRVDTILRNADSIAFLICEMGRQLDPVPGTSGHST
ncbi:dermonecrotic toxin domain-containing protein [Pseudomonas sp. NPDC089569]|uniref:dermonecrotic toxin domain-containing protein n=1 Tax=Pseudomonas sp. NPDC089569 TaxID=3390722 RepID=UPI003D079AF2